MGSTDGNLVVVGEVAGLYGVKGWVRIRSHTDPIDALLGYDQWHLECNRGGWREAPLEAARRHGKGLIAKFEGIGNRDEAALQVGRPIAVLRAALPDPAAGEYYWCDLEGLAVRHRDGRRLGRVAYLIETGANDVLVVRGDDDTERLVPFLTGRVVRAVDFDAGEIVVDWDWD